MMNKLVNYLHEKELSKYGTFTKEGSHYTVHLNDGTHVCIHIPNKGEKYALTVFYDGLSKEMHDFLNGYPNTKMKTLYMTVKCDTFNDVTDLLKNYFEYLKR